MLWTIITVVLQSIAVAPTILECFGVVDRTSRRIICEHGCALKVTRRSFFTMFTLQCGFLGTALELLDCAYALPTVQFILCLFRYLLKQTSKDSDLCLEL